jgi:argininosuccinate synthase
VKEAVIVASNGGATSYMCIHYLANHMNRNVVVYMANLGGAHDVTSLGKDAYELGAAQVHFTDMRKHLIADVAFPALRAGAEFANGFFLARAMGNISVIKGLVNIARENGITVAAHGSTITSNEQVRFENILASIAPEMEFISPPRLWEWRTREDILTELRKILGRDNKRLRQMERYAIDENLWGSVHSMGLVDTEWAEVSPDAWGVTQDPLQAPEDPDEVEIGFECGFPISMNGDLMNPVTLMEELNLLGAEHGVGRADRTSDGLMSIKQRELCEYPGAKILFTAHRALELVCQPQKVLQHQELITIRYGELIVQGDWFTTLREALEGYLEVTQQVVCGIVKVRLHKGSCTIVRVSSPYALAAGRYVRLEEVLSPRDLEGFNRVATLQNRLEALRNERIRSGGL